MRLKGLEDRKAAAPADDVATTGERSDPAPGGTPLSGSWAAVRWEYERRHDGRRADIVGDLGGSVTLSMTDASYVLSWDDGRSGPRSGGGSLLVTQDEWIDFAAPDGSFERLGFRRAAGTLVLRSEHSAWDFDGTGDEPAEFTAVMVRL